MIANRLVLVLICAAAVCCSVISGATGPASVDGGAEPGLHYQKLLAKLEVLDTKITRVETTSLERFSSFEAKLDKVSNQLANVSGEVPKSDVGRVQVEIQQFRNHSLEQLNSLANSITIIHSLLAEGQRQKQALPIPVGAGGDSYLSSLAFQVASSVYESCDTVPYNDSRVVSLLPEPGFGDAFPALCDQEYESGGWIVFQNRVNGSVDFYRGWKEYKNGFGNLNGEFWLGLDKLHALTYSAPYELQVLLEDFDNKTVVARYARFAVGNEQESYAITKLGDYNGTAGDGLGYHRSSKFSTMDANHDFPGNNGGVDWTGAWWYRRGHHSNLNGQYLRGPVDPTKFHGKGVTWNPFRGDNYSLKRSRMLIKRIK